MGDFTDRMRAAIAPDIVIPEPLVACFDWLEREGLVRQPGTDEDAPYAVLDSSQEGHGLTIEVPHPGDVAGWGQADPSAIAQRLAPFCRTGGDGSKAALWRDDDGVSRIVHVGSGSGSVLLGVMVDNAVDFLRLLAIGYEELCWADEYDKAPEEIWQSNYPAEDYDDDDADRPPPPTKPHAFRRWVETRFETTIPPVARPLVRNMPSMDDDGSDDPFFNWLRGLENA
ncbi:MAG: hypothetical protein WA948_10390 [Pontixanthobacter sp.]